ncbi:MAG: hypothetical protein GY862_20250 [Gammaproteobacteria bacterium]|nr:hypothetical protein [Gammaproteobacteria bacterium]
MKNSCEESLKVDAESLERAIHAAFKKYLPKICEEVVNTLSQSTGLTKEGLTDYSPNVQNLFDLAATGNKDKLNEALQKPREELIEIIKSLGFDPSRRVRRWKDIVRLREFLVEELLLRANRNCTFLSE